MKDRAALDTSDVLALCFAENGAKQEAELGADGLMSTVLAGERNGFLLQKMETMPGPQSVPMAASVNPFVPCDSSHSLLFVAYALLRQ
jgi:hypothetical protein